MSGFVTIAAISFCKRSTISFGVPFGAKNSLHCFGFLPGDAGFGKGRYIRQCRGAFFGRDRKRAQLARQHQLRRRRHGDERCRHFIGQDGLRRRAAAFVGRDGEVEMIRDFEQVAGEVRCGAETGRSERELVGIGLNHFDQFLRSLCLDRRMDDQDIWSDSRKDDRNEVLERVIGTIFVEARVHDITRGGHQERVAVARRSRDIDGTDIAAGPANVLDIELLSEFFRQLLPDQSRHHVSWSAGRKRHNDLHRMIGITCGLGRTAGDYGCGQCENTHCELHGLLPIRAVLFISLFRSWPLRSPLPTLALPS